MVCSNAEMTVDVAVVGAGVAGAYSAWRLRGASRGEAGRRIALFEASHRLGGRLMSTALPGMPGMRAEFGGMRYPRGHVQVAGLVEALGLATRPFVVHDPANIAHLRGRVLRLGDLGNPDVLPYALGQQAHLLNEDSITAHVARRCLPPHHLPPPGTGWDTANAPAHLREALVDGIPLKDWDLGALFQKWVGPELARFEQDISGYDCIMPNWNAADGLAWLMASYGNTQAYRSLVDGFDALPRTLIDRFARSGGQVLSQHRLCEIEPLPAHGPGGAGVRLGFDVEGRRVWVRAGKVILALPRKALEAIAMPALAPDAPPPAMAWPPRPLSSVRPIPLFKLALCYRERWWDALGIMHGRSVTDMPIRQCFYWRAPAPSLAGMILIYNDRMDELIRQVGGPDAPAFVNRVDGHEAVDPAWRDHPAPGPLVAEAHRQLMAMHGLAEADAPMPYAAAYKAWCTQEESGGANFWPPGVDSVAVSRQALQPLAGLPIHVCGEAYSHLQGWVEGALATAERVLQDHFGMAPPPDDTDGAPAA